MVEVKEVKKKRVYSENEEDDDELEEDEDGNIIRTDEDLLLDDEYDDTYGEMPDGYVISEPIKLIDEETEPEEDWGF